MTRTPSNNMLLIQGFILVTILATAKSAEAEITMEAAFQGHCGHTSPCEQLCYEIHDGMYECDCIEGYELNKNGYSCQVINSTNSGDSGHSKSDEDVLYQKGASFSAKLAGTSSGNNNANNNNYNDGDSSGNRDGIDDNYITGDGPNGNSNDYYISSESISFSNEQQDGVPDVGQDVPELYPSTGASGPQQPQQQTQRKQQQHPDVITHLPSVGAASTITTTATTTKRPSGRKVSSKKLLLTPTKKASKGSAKAETVTKYNSNSNNNMEDDYYAKQDMSIYDDVNNNQLNLRPLNQQAYQPLAAASNTTAPDPLGEGSACNMECGPEGQCERLDAGRSGARCLCPFGRTGENCADDITVRVPKFSRKSWLAFPALRGAYKHVQIRIEFRPESFDGIVLLSGERDDLTGDFMALLLNKGFVEFWFDCGSGVGSVRSRETILLNEWNSVIIYRHRWDAWMVLNHGSKVQGRSNGLFSRITFREPVFLGGTGNITGLAKRLPVFSGFIGCIRRFVANEHEYKFDEHPVGDVTKGFDIQDCATDKCFKYPCQHGGKCLPTDQGAVCLCPIGFVGDLCEIRMDLQVPAFNGSSYLRYAPLGDSALIWLELKVILKPEQADGLILYSGPGGRHGDFVALSLNNGYVEFTFDLGSGPAVVRSDQPLTIGQWHTIKLSRTARLAVLKIDQLPEVMTISSNGFWHLSLPESLFLGGVNHVDHLPLDFKSNPFFTGCIQKIEINGHAVAIISEALGGSNIGNCPHACVARPCGPFSECVPQMESYECRCSPSLNTHCNKAAAAAGVDVPAVATTQMNNARRMNNNKDGNGNNNNYNNNDNSNEHSENVNNDRRTTPRMGAAHNAKRYIGSIGNAAAAAATTASAGAAANKKATKATNEQYDWKAKKAQMQHKQLKLSKYYGHKSSGHTIAKTTPKVAATPTTSTTAAPTTTTTTTTMSPSEIRAAASESLDGSEDYIEIDDDDIIYRDVQGMQKEYGSSGGEEAGRQREYPLFNTMAGSQPPQQQWNTFDGLDGATTTTTSTPAPSSIPSGEPSRVLEQQQHKHQDHHHQQHHHHHHHHHQQHHRTEHDSSHHHKAEQQQQQRASEHQREQLAAVARAPPRQYATKSDPYYGKPAKFEQKLSKLPTHYESFQTNPDSDILTFDDNIELRGSAEYGDQPPPLPPSPQPPSGSAYPDPDDYNYDYGGEFPGEADDHGQPLAGSEPAGAYDAIEQHQQQQQQDDGQQQHYEFTMDESTLFDGQDSGDEYHRKQLARDMRRIMANTQRERSTATPTASSTTTTTTTTRTTTSTTTTTPKPPTSTTRQPILEVDTYDYMDDGPVASSEVLAAEDANAALDADDLLEPVHDEADEHDDSDDYEVVAVEQQQPQQHHQETTTQQTPHTDWSLLNKFELSGEHHSQIGVHKNFGACFSGQDSYFHYSDAETMSQVISYNIDLNLRIKTHSQNGVILWTGRQGSTDEHADFLSLGIEDGYLHFRYDLGSGELDIRFNMTRVSDGLWHRVRAIRNSQAGYLEVDGRKSATLSAPGKLRQLNTDMGLYVGGMPDVSYFTRRKYENGIVGCISEIILAGELKLNFDPNTWGTAHNVETGIL